MAYSELIAGRIRRTLASRRGVVEKKMFGGLSFLARGKMLIGVMGDKVLIRCKLADQAALLKSPSVRHMTFGGKTMRGWLYVTGPSTKTAAGLRKWIAIGEAALKQ